MKLSIMLAALALSTSLAAQNYISLGGEYKSTNSRFNKGFGFDAGIQFAVSERLTVGPQIGYNYFEYENEWRPFGYGTGAGDAAIEQYSDRQSFYGGASAHYLLFGLNRKLQLHVGLGLNCHVFRQTDEWRTIGSSGNDAYARLEAALPVRLTYVPNEDQRLRFFTAFIPSYLAPSDNHKVTSLEFGQGIGVLNFRAGVQIVVGDL